MCRMRSGTLQGSGASSAILIESLLIYLKMYSSDYEPCCQIKVQNDRRVQLLRFVIQLDGTVKFSL